MGWYKSEAWREILQTAEEWLEEAADAVEDPEYYEAIYERKRLEYLTFQLMRLLDAHTRIDPQPLWNLNSQIQVRRGESTGELPSPERLHSELQVCVGIMYRLRFLGIVSEEPADATIASANIANIPEIFPDGAIDRKDIRELVVRLHETREDTTSQIDIAREITGESVANCPKAKSMLARARTLRRNGRLRF